MRSTFTLALLAITCSATAQLQNGGFEDLNTSAMPSFWSTPLELIVVGDSVVVDSAKYLLNTTDVHGGQHAAELRNSYNYSQDLGSAGTWFATPAEEGYSGFISPEVPVIDRPERVRFWAKYAPVEDDLGYAEVTVLDLGFNVIGEGSLTIPATGAYTEFLVPIDYVLTDSAAYISIRFTTMVPGGNPHLGTRMLVDDVSIDYTATGIADAAADPLRMFPNPAADRVQLMGLPGPVKVRVLDASGRVQLQGRVLNNALGVEALAPGAYTVQCMMDGAVVQGPLVIVR